ncbi:VWA domain-containing protein [Candidatus Dojkabacteria bacterium]|nr:VWA domain-containing protein [Candidatus Dojkabacteria bacterium]
MSIIRTINFLSYIKSMQKNTPNKYILIMAGALSLVVMTFLFVFIYLMTSESFIDDNKSKPTGSLAVPVGIHNTDNTNPSKIYEFETDELKGSARLGSDTIMTRNGLTYLLIELEGKKPLEENSINIPLNISIVIDRSGSMCGEKLDSIKTALKSISSMLDENDTISIISYETDVQVVLKPQQFNESSFNEAVDSLSIGGSTNLEGGLREGVKSVKKKLEEAQVNRVILLSDGLANVGLSTPSDLSILASSLSGEKISVSTIGVGVDYDEKVLTEIAKATKGNYYFMGNPEEANAIFEIEFNSALKLVAQDIELEFNLNPDFEVSTGVGYQLENKYKFNPYNIYSDKKVSYLFQIEAINPEELSEEEILLANISIKYSKPAQTDSDPVQLNVPVKATMSSEIVNLLADDNVYKNYIKALIAENKLKIYEALDKGDNAAANVLLQTSITEIENANERLDGEFSSEAKDLQGQIDFVDELEENDGYVNDSEKGRFFQKDNQGSAYDEIYNK